jgi:hypothetical protein
MTNPALIPEVDSTHLVEWLPHGVIATPTGLQFTEALDYETWERFGRDLDLLCRLQEARLQTVQWWVADWLIYGEGRGDWGEMYTQATQETGYNKRTLANMAWVASAVELSRRHDNLTFAHHAEVAALPPADQDELLNEAHANHYSTHDLRRMAQDRKAENNGQDPGIVRAERALGRALEDVAGLWPDQWAQVIVGALIRPLRRECAATEYSAFVVELRQLLETLDA